MNETTKTLCHKWSKAKKAAYNREYYQKNKGYWEKYKFSDRETMGDNDVMIRKADNALGDAKNRAERAEELRKSNYKKADDYKSMAEAKAAGFNTGITDTVSNLRSKAHEHAHKGTEYWYQRRDIENKQINPRQGDLAYRLALRNNEYGAAASRPATSSRVENKSAVKTKTTINPVTGVKIKSTSKTGNLDWKLKPVKNKATRKAKEFVSNWKSGASSISDAVKTPAAKAGKNFIDNWKSGVSGIAGAFSKKRK